MKYPRPYRRALNQVIDNVLMHARAEVGGLDPRPRAVALLKKELEHNFYEHFMAWVVGELLNEFYRREVYKRVDSRRADYVPREAKNGNHAPDIAYEKTKHPVWIKPPGPGGVPTPKLMAEASDDDHRRISERREQQALPLLRESRWHKGVVDWADKEGISKNLVGKLFEIEAPEDTIDTHFFGLERLDDEPSEADEDE